MWYFYVAINISIMLPKKPSIKKYKFKELKTFASDEWMANASKNYRSVFDKAEVNYLRAEFSFYNKLFDKKNWKCKVLMKCYELTDDIRREICALETEREVKVDENIVFVRDGWGNAAEGAYWKKGEYAWVAYIDDEQVGEAKFYVNDIAKVTQENNAYFDIDYVKFFAGDYNGWQRKERTYLKKFSRGETQYVWVEARIRNKVDLDWNYELFFNFYNGAGILKGQILRTGKIASDRKDFRYTFDVGWGNDVVGSWKSDWYTVEIVFMDCLTAVVPLELGEKNEEGIPARVDRIPKYKTKRVQDTNIINNAFEDLIDKVTEPNNEKEIKSSNIVKENNLEKLGYQSFPLPTQLKSFFSEVLKGSEDYLALKGQKLWISLDLSLPDNIFFKYVDQQSGKNISLEDIQSVLAEYLASVRKANLLLELLKRNSAPEAQMLSYRIKLMELRVAELEAMLENEKKDKSKLLLLLDKSLGQSQSQSPSVHIQSVGVFNQAANSQNVNFEGSQHISHGISVEELNVIINNLNDLLTKAQIDPGTKRLIEDDLEAIKQEASKEMPDKSKVTKLFEGVQKITKYVTLGTEFIEGMKGLWHTIAG